MTDQGIKKLNPDTNIFQVSSQKGPNQVIFTSKIFLQKYEDIELHGLGEATRLVAIASEELRRNFMEGYAVITKILTETFQSEESENHRGGKKVKLIVKLQRTQDAEERITKELLEKEEKKYEVKKDEEDQKNEVKEEVKEDQKNEVKNEEEDKKNEVKEEQEQKE